MSAAVSGLASMSKSLWERPIGGPGAALQQGTPPPPPSLKCSPALTHSVLISEAPKKPAKTGKTVFAQTSDAAIHIHFRHAVVFQTQVAISSVSLSEEEIMGAAP